MLIAAPIVCGGYVFGPCFVIQYFVSLFCSHLDGEERADWFTLTVFLVFSGRSVLCGSCSRCRGLVCGV